MFFTRSELAVLEAIAKSTKRRVLATDDVIIERTGRLFSQEALASLEEQGLIKSIGAGRWFALKDTNGAQLITPEAAKRYEKQKTLSWG